jgi:hypothetical protein
LWAHGHDHDGCGWGKEICFITPLFPKFYKKTSLSPRLIEIAGASKTMSYGGRYILRGIVGTQADLDECGWGQRNMFQHLSFSLIFHFLPICTKNIIVSSLD